MLKSAIILLAIVCGASASQAGWTTNALAVNALAVNGLAMNALSSNGLHLNSITSNALSYNGVSATAQSGGMRALSVELPGEQTQK